MNNALTKTQDYEWNMFEEVKEKTTLDVSTTLKAVKLFEKYRSKKIFLNDSFSDDVWIINDEYSHRGIYFEFNSDSYRLNYQKHIGLSPAELTNYIKAYIVFSIGDLSSATLINIVNDIKNVLETPLNMLNKGNVFLSVPWQLETILELIPFIDEDVKDELLVILGNYIDEKMLSNSMNKRDLCDFYSYFRLDHILDKFWSENITEREWLFYFPVYLWWKITAIIPTRPREFVLLPRNCIYEDQNAYFIKMRKNNIKGSNKKITYKIATDYTLKSFPITESMYNDIKKYILLTENYEDNELHTLFRAESHYAFFKKKKIKISRYYTSVNLNCALRLFYTNIVQDKYKIKVIRNTSEQLTDANAIQYIRIGDTRHVAMINAIAEGVSLEIIAEMAGHDSIEMSAHYFSNMSTYIECRTYAQYINSLEDNDDNYVFGENYFPLMENERYIDLDDGGRCYSKLMIAGDTSDCLKVMSDNGEIGYCLSCYFYKNSGFEFYFNLDKTFKTKIDKNMAFLREIISLQRKGKAKSEDIKRIFLNFKADKSSFEKYLLQKFKSQGENTWEEKRK